MAGTIIADTLTHSTAGSVTTDYVVNGSAKAWHKGNAAGTSLLDSLNVSSLGDSGTGIQTINLSSAMDNSSYSGHCTVMNNATYIGLITGATTSLYLGRVKTTSASAVDEIQGTVIHGDLA